MPNVACDCPQVKEGKLMANGAIWCQGCEHPATSHGKYGCTEKEWRP